MYAVIYADKLVLHLQPVGHQPLRLLLALLLRLPLGLLSPPPP